MMTVLRIIELPPARREIHASFETLNRVLWWMVALILVFGPILIQMFTVARMGAGAG